MIKPHGSDQLNPLYVEDAARREQLTREAAGLPTVVVHSAAAANAVMLGSGYFNPLTGYMTMAAALCTSAVAEAISRYYSLTIKQSAPAAGPLPRAELQVEGGATARAWIASVKVGSPASGRESARMVIERGPSSRISMTFITCAPLVP